jgi:uncharacterized protein
MRSRTLARLAVLGVFLLLILPSVVGYYTDWLWFKETGYASVFLRSLNAQALVFAATFAVLFAFLYFNLRLARGSITRPQIVLGTGVDGRQIAIEGSRLAGVAFWGSLLASFLLALTASGDWLKWLTFFKGAPFPDSDPLFGKNVAFYVFRLPVWQAIQREAFVATLLVLIGCGVYYVLGGSFIIESRYGASFWPKVRLIAAARRHLGLLTALFFALLAWGAWLRIPQTLLTPASILFGASYADVHARMPFMRAEIAVLAVGAVLAILHGFGRRGWPVPVAVVLYLVVSIGGGLYAGFVQTFSVTPNELDKETPYIVHNIAATRRAFALDRVQEKELSGDAELTADAVINNVGTMENVRLWDHQPLLQTFAQIQEIRPYYDFFNVDNDRYLIKGKYRQVMLSARELNTENMPNRSWVNERMQYTHGYGLTLGPVNQVTKEGLPVLLIRNIPPESTIDLKVEEPSIYFGEISSSYVLVRTNQPEFHYPRQSGDENETTIYSGTGGVPIGSLARRFLFAIRFATTDILVTKALTPESRILFNRRISERVRLIAPFLEFDTDPYPVVSGGRIFWMQDAYTTTAHYPYSKTAMTQWGELNYIRNSVKVVIDAYNGTTTFYLAEPDDPIAKTLASIFPGLLRPMTDMPPDLRQHVRYPEDIFKIQAAMYTTYHMTNPLLFYNKEDQWQLPTLDSGQNQTQMQPYYMIMKLPGEHQTEFLQMLPFTPRVKDNLAAWMVARSDSAHYGHMLVFQLPKQKLVYGPRQVVGRINQDQLISPQVTLWNQQGSEVIWGTLLVIPVDESLLYVRPLYLRSTETRIPELKRVVVVYQSQIVMADTFVEALTKIFGRRVGEALPPDRLESSATSVVPLVPLGEDQPLTPRPGVTTPAGAQTLAELAAEANLHLDRANKALKDGDLATFGEEYKKLNEIIAAMAKIKKQ